MVKILQKEEPELRRVSLPVPDADIGSTRIKKILADMKAALASQEDGVAIAAPQIGINERIFVVAGRAFVIADETADKKKTPPPPDMVFINPDIIRQSKKTEWMEEGCLSIRYLYGRVRRAPKVTVRAIGEDGATFTRNASGLLAQIFQHEIDHLNGILFTDTAEDVKEILPKHSEETL